MGQASAETSRSKAVRDGEEASKVLVKDIEPAAGSCIRLLSKALAEGNSPDSEPLSDVQVTGHLVSSMLRGAIMLWIDWRIRRAIREHC